MAIDLPITTSDTAADLAWKCTDVDLSRAITYLELVQEEEIQPGPEIERLLGDDTLLLWNVWEVRAVQNRLALALCIRRNVSKQQTEGSYPLSRIISNCVECHRESVLKSYNEW